MCNIDISVIVPVYNVENTLEKCVDSIIDQTFTGRYEIILVDDGSTDKSGTMCDYFQQKYVNRIKVIHKENGGLSSARLAGYKYSCGRYIMSVDSDDYVSETFLDKMYDAVVSHNAEIAMCSYYNVSNGVVTRNSGQSKILIRKSAIKGLILSNIGYDLRYSNEISNSFFWSKIFRKDILTEDCFVSERKYFAEDMILNLIVLPRVQSIVIIDDPLYYYVTNPKSLTSSFRKNVWEMRTNFYSYVCDYVIRNNLDCDVRLRNQLRCAVIHTLNNASKSDNGYEYFISTYNLLRKDSLFKKSISEIKKHEMLRSHYLIFFLLKINAPYLIYHYFRHRYSQLNQ